MNDAWQVCEGRRILRTRGRSDGWGSQPQGIGHPDDQEEVFRQEGGMEPLEITHILKIYLYF